MSDTVDAEIVDTKHPTRWKPGQSGNPAGRPPKGHALSEFLESGLDQVSEIEAELARRKGTKARTRLETIRDMLDVQILKGNMRAIELYFNRLEGKAIAKVEHSGEVKHKGRIDHEHVARIDSAMAQLRVLRERAAERAQIAEKSSA